MLTVFDLTRLTPKDIQHVVVKGGPELREFYGKLSGFAGNIPPGMIDKELHKKLQIKADEVLADWRLVNPT
jgi:hypothetical protein